MKLDNPFEIQGHDILLRFKNSITYLKTGHLFIHDIYLTC